MRVAKANSHWYVLLDDTIGFCYNTATHQLVPVYVKESHFKRLEVPLTTLPDDVYLLFIEALLGE